MKNEKTVGFTCGSFDLMHAGHVLMFEECKKSCDYLIVGVQSDPSVDRPEEKNRPIQEFAERILLVNSVRWVDEVVPYHTEEDLYDLLKEISPDVRIIGDDWRGKEYTGHDLDINVVFNSRSHTYSTSELRLRVYEAEKSKVEDHAEKMSKQNYSGTGKYPTGSD